MDDRTGRIVDHSEVEKMPASERKHFIEVQRDLSRQEKASRQVQLYSPCACGSGEKFKFCCYKKP